tara:strand:+ start:3566 stop:3763 length:198 start_codon:yes stop_codon:yes gene_type:complete
MAFKRAITAQGKITFSNSNSQPLPVTLGSNTVVLIAYGDNVNVWYESGNVRASQNFTGEVYYRVI